MEQKEEQAAVKITKQRAREYLKTWGGYWFVRAILNTSTNYITFQARPLFGEWSYIRVDSTPDGMNDHNIYLLNENDWEWIDAIPA